MHLDYQYFTLFEFVIKFWVISWNNEETFIIYISFIEGKQYHIVSPYQDLEHYCFSRSLVKRCILWYTFIEQCSQFFLGLNWILYILFSLLFLSDFIKYAGECFDKGTYATESLKCNKPPPTDSAGKPKAETRDEECS